jgi:hypothetical protein
MRIASLRIKPVALILAIGYAALSPFAIIFAVWLKVNPIRIPLGVVAPLVAFNINFDIQPPTSVFWAVLFVLFAVLCYAATGWLTWMAAVLVFNFIARRTGGIEAAVLTSEPVSVKPSL